MASERAEETAHNEDGKINEEITEDNDANENEINHVGWNWKRNILH